MSLTQICCSQLKEFIKRRVELLTPTEQDKIATACTKLKEAMASAATLGNVDEAVLQLVKFRCDNFDSLIAPFIFHPSIHTALNEHESLIEQHVNYCPISGYGILPLIAPSVNTSSERELIHTLNMTAFKAWKSNALYNCQLIRLLDCNEFITPIGVVSGRYKEFKDEREAAKTEAKAQSKRIIEQYIVDYEKYLTELEQKLPANEHLVIRVATTIYQVVKATTPIKHQQELELVQLIGNIQVLKQEDINIALMMKEALAMTHLGSFRLTPYMPMVQHHTAFPVIIKELNELYELLNKSMELCKSLSNSMKEQTNCSYRSAKAIEEASKCLDKLNTTFKEKLETCVTQHMENLKRVIDKSTVKVKCDEALQYLQQFKDLQLPNYTNSAKIEEYVIEQTARCETARANAKQ